MKLKSTILIFATLTIFALFLGANKTLACSSDADCPQGQSCAQSCGVWSCTSSCVGTPSTCTDSTCSPTGPFQCYTCAAQGFCSAFTSTSGCTSDCSGCSGGGGGGGNPPGGGCNTYSTTPLTDTYTTPNGVCSVTITHLGWNNSDLSNPSNVTYRSIGSTSTVRQVGFSDNPPSACQDNLWFTNDWSQSTDQTFSITNTINGKSAGNSLGSGWQLNATGCTIGSSCTAQAGPSQVNTDTVNSPVAWTGSLNYCGDGACSCGENAVTCLADCALTPPTVIPPALSPSCSNYGNSATVSWNATSDATYYQVRVSPSNHTTPPNCSNLGSGEYCYNGITATQAYPTVVSFAFSSTPGATYSWWVYGCDTINGTAVCSPPVKGSDFTCALPPCPDGLGACGTNPPNLQNMIYCNKTWVPNPGPGNAYDLWCAKQTTVGNNPPSRPYCYTCTFPPAPTSNPAWIQINGDVHSNTGIIAPGGP